MTKVLIADDDAELGALLADYLGAQGVTAQCVLTAEEAIARIDDPRGTVDVLVLDVMLPGIDGLTALRRIRQRHDLPILMLSGRGEPVDRILGLELGADDYLAKPCLPRELLARINALTRRSAAVASGVSDPVRIGTLTLFTQQRAARLGDEALTLTGAEFDVLLALMHHAGEVISRAALTEQGLHRPLEKEDRAIDVHISRLRKKLAHANAPVIRSVRGAGYILASEPDQ